jgi:hypothetical protein
LGHKREKQHPKNICCITPMVFLAQKQAMMGYLCPE